MDIQELCGRLDRVGRGITQLGSQLADEGALTLLEVVYVVGEQTLGCRTPVEVSPIEQAAIVDQRLVPPAVGRGVDRLRRWENDAGVAYGL